MLLGGGLGAAAAAALAYVPETSAWYQCPVRAALLGDDAGVIGAALHALGHAPAAHPPATHPSATHLPANHPSAA